MNKINMFITAVCVLFLICFIVSNIKYYRKGFAKNRPTARYGPAARGPRRSGGPEARWPSPDFPQSFCPAVNPRACTDLHQVWACKMDDGEFEVVYHF